MQTTTGSLASLSSPRFRIPVLPAWSSIVAAAFVWLLNPQILGAQRGDLIVDIGQIGAPGAIATGTNAAFLVKVSNATGQDIRDDVLVQVTIPPEFIGSSAGGTGFQCTGGTVSCTTNGLNARGTKEFRISTTAPRTAREASQQFILAAQVDPDNTVRERDNGNNSDNLTVTVEPRADLRVSTAGSPTTLVIPELVYFVTARNEGDGAASNVLVESTLPKDAAFVGVERNQFGTCLQNSVASNGARQVNCTLASLPAGANREVRIIGELIGSTPDGVQVLFGAEVDPDKTVTERNETNNTAFVLTTMRAPSSSDQREGSQPSYCRHRGANLSCRRPLHAAELDRQEQRAVPVPRYDGRDRVALWILCANRVLFRRL